MGIWHEHASAAYEAARDAGVGLLVVTKGTAYPGSSLALLSGRMARHSFITSTSAASASATYSAALERFTVRHSLSYSHSDQALLRNPSLDDCWDGLVVPGTLATYYFEGTGGFVLTRGVPYVIDPRTPLLQTIEISRPAPKASHLEFAAIHDPDVVDTWPEHEIPRSHWEDRRSPIVVRNVLGFQSRYFNNRYGKGRQVQQAVSEAGRRVFDEAPEDPLRLVPPYWAVTDVADPWWTLAREAIEIGVHDYPRRVRPIVTIKADVDLQPPSRH